MSIFTSDTPQIQFFGCPRCRRKFQSPVVNKRRIFSSSPLVDALLSIGWKIGPDGILVCPFCIDSPVCTAEPHDFEALTARRAMPWMAGLLDGPHLVCKKCGLVEKVQIERQEGSAA